MNVTTGREYSCNLLESRVTLNFNEPAGEGCYYLVNLHERSGYKSVFKTCKGNGTTVTFELPDFESECIASLLKVKEGVEPHRACGKVGGNLCGGVLRVLKQYPSVRCALSANVLQRAFLSGLYHMLTSEVGSIKIFVPQEINRGGTEPFRLLPKRTPQLELFPRRFFALYGQIIESQDQRNSGIHFDFNDSFVHMNTFPDAIEKTLNDEYEVYAQDAAEAWRFVRLLLHLAGSEILRDLPFFSDMVIESARNMAFHQIVGQKVLSSEFQEPFDRFTQLRIPRGVILWGPPGTGKTFLIDRLCKYLGLVPLYVNMSAGDFEQGIQGDAERMIDQLQNRAAEIPWLACYIAIDEIDGLAPDRSGSESSGGKVNLLAVLLSIIGGNRDEHKNFVIFGSTNRLERMDEAFLRRMHVKAFIGRASREDRMDWIDRAADPKNRVDFKIRGALTSDLDHQKRSYLFENIRGELCKWTLNFSNEAMQRMLEMFLLSALHPTTHTNVLTEDYLRKLAKKAVDSVCETDQIFLGTYVVHALLTEKDNKNRLQADLQQNVVVDRLGSSQVYQIIFDIRDKDVDDRGEEVQFRVGGNVFDNETFGFCYGNEPIGQRWKELKKKHDIRKLLEKRHDVEMRAKKHADLLAFYDEEAAVRFIDRVNHEIEIFENNPEVKRKLEEMRAVECLSMASLSLRSGKRLQHALSTLLSFAMKEKANCVQLFDGELLMRKDSVTDESAVKSLQGVFKECRKYEKSLLIIHLDSCCGLLKDLSGLKGDLQHSSRHQKAGGETQTTNYHIQRPLLFNACMQKFLRGGIEEVENGHGRALHVALLVEDAYLLSRVKDVLQWDTVKDLEHKKEDEDNAQLVPCVFCLKMFSVNDNPKNECGEHRGPLVGIVKARDIHGASTADEGRQKTMQNKSKKDNKVKVSRG